jgi:hypothetical protein
MVSFVAPPSVEYSTALAVRLSAGEDELKISRVT